MFLEWFWLCDFGVWFPDSGEVWLDSFSWIVLRDSSSIGPCLFGGEMNMWKIRMWTKLDYCVCLYTLPFFTPTYYSILNVYFILRSWMIHTCMLPSFSMFCLGEIYNSAAKHVTCVFVLFWPPKVSISTNWSPKIWTCYVSKFMTLVEWTC